MKKTFRIVLVVIGSLLVAQGAAARQPASPQLVLRAADHGTWSQRQ